MFTSTLPITGIPVALVLSKGNSIDISYQDAEVVSDFTTYQSLNQSSHMEITSPSTIEETLLKLEKDGWIPIHYER